MADTIFKILLFMKRRGDISIAQFRDYYENSHAPLCARYSGQVCRYVRRYITPQPHPETGPAAEMAFDVITELWFDQEATYLATLDYITTNIMPDNIIEDEMNLFDRNSFRIAILIECETPIEDLGRS